MGHPAKKEILSVRADPRQGAKNHRFPDLGNELMHPTLFHVALSLLPNPKDHKQSAKQTDRKKQTVLVLEYEYRYIYSQKEWTRSPRLYLTLMVADWAVGGGWSRH